MFLKVAIALLLLSLVGESYRRRFDDERAVYNDDNDFDYGRDYGYQYYFDKNDKRAFDDYKDDDYENEYGNGYENNDGFVSWHYNEDAFDEDETKYEKCVKDCTHKVGKDLCVKNCKEDEAIRCNQGCCDTFETCVKTKTATEIKGCETQADACEKTCAETWEKELSDDAKSRITEFFNLAVCKTDCNLSREKEADQKKCRQKCQSESDKYVIEKKSVSLSKAGAKAAKDITTAYARERCRISECGNPDASDVFKKACLACCDATHKEKFFWCYAAGKAAEEAH